VNGACGQLALKNILQRKEEEEEEEKKDNIVKDIEDLGMDLGSGGQRDEKQKNGVDSNPRRFEQVEIAYSHKRWMMGVILVILGISILLLPTILSFSEET